MNLRIPDAPALVAFLHRVVTDSGTPILSSDGFHVVEIDGLVFYHGAEPVTVGGPFQSVAHLVRFILRSSHSTSPGERLRSVATTRCVERSLR
jgi:hypothetical protein